MNAKTPKELPPYLEIPQLSEYFIPNNDRVFKEDVFNHMDEIEKIEAQAAEIRQKNNEIDKQRRAEYKIAIDELKAHLINMGLKVEWNEFVGRNRRMVTKVNPIFTKLVTELQKNYFRENYNRGILGNTWFNYNCYSIQVGNQRIAMDHGTTVFEALKNTQRRFNQIRATEALNKAIFSKAIAMIASGEVKVDDSDLIDLTPQQIVDLVTEIARNNFIETEYPDGTEMHISCCEECSTWFVGDLRCSCTNRRIYLEVEGDIVNGFYANAMAD